MNQKTQQQGLTKIDTIRTLLERMKPEISKVLPKHLDPARIIRMALTDFQTVKHLNECTQESFLGALMECSQLGLEPGRVLGQAYLLPFKNKQGQYICRLIPGYQGLCAIARRSGEIKAIYARAVYENDEFVYWYGLNENLTHKPIKGERGELCFVYAVARLASGENQFEVMDLAEIVRIRERSRASEDGPWVTDFVEMAKKTVLKRLCKSLPASTELRTSLAMDVHEDEIEHEPVVEDSFGVIPSKQEITKVRQIKPGPRFLESEEKFEFNDLIDARIQLHDLYSKLPRTSKDKNPIDCLREASNRDNGHLWLGYDQIDTCEDVEWLRSTMEKLEKMIQ